MILIRLANSKLQGKICEKCQKRVTQVSAYGPNMQGKCLFKALIFGTCKKNILIYSHVRFQLYQSHSMTAIGLKSGKKSTNWVAVGISGTLK